MPWGNADVGIPGVEVNLCIYLGTPESVDQIANEWEQVLILFGDFIESPVVNAEAEQTILLLGKEYWSSGSLWRLHCGCSTSRFGRNWYEPRAAL